MPTIIRIGIYRFHSYSDANNEPPHIDIGDAECKFWLEPVRLAKNIGVKPHQLREIEKLVLNNQILLVEKYNEYHNNR